MTDALIYGAAATAVVAVWVAGLFKLDVFTPDDVRALRRLADLRGYARPTSRLQQAAARLPLLRRLQVELDLDRLLAIAGRNETALAFVGQTAAWGLVVFAGLFALDVVGRAISGDWPLYPLLAPAAAVLAVLLRLARLRADARRARRSVERTLGDLLMPLAILVDARGLQLHDGVRILSRCVDDDALERLLDMGGWRRFVTQRVANNRELYRRIGDAFGSSLLKRIADAEAAALVGVPEREVYTNLAESVYRERLAEARARAARAKVLVTLPVAAMLIPLLILLGAPTLHAITTGLQGG